jgi:hypothetical protein
MRTQRFGGAYGRISQTRRVLSIELDRRWVPSGLSERPVTVSLCPFNVIVTAPLRRSHTCTCSPPAQGLCKGRPQTRTAPGCAQVTCNPSTLIVLSSPPVYTSSPSLLNATQVTWNLWGNVAAERFPRRSKSLQKGYPELLLMSRTFSHPYMHMNTNLAVQSSLADASS